MAELQLVENLNEVKKNILQFNYDLKENEEMRRRFFSLFRQWYYVKELDMFAPSKYIGYKDMNAHQYNNKDGTGADGRETEVVLKQWFIKKDIPELLVELQERFIDFGKINKRSEIHILKSEEQLFNEPNSTANEYIDIVKIIADDSEQVEVKETEKEQILKSRVGQSTFKRDLVYIQRKCRLCGVSDERFLVASHIKPWSQSSNQERLDVNNGLLLCPNHDVLFDKGYISFDDDGTILISDSLDGATRVLLNINETMNIRMNEGQKAYMKWHRENVFQI